MQELLKHFHELSLHPKNAMDLKGLIIQLAIQGKLTADWRARNPDLISGENSAENLLKDIKVEKAKLVQEKKIKKENTLAAIKNSEISYKLPERWQWYRLRDIGFTQTGSTPPKKNPDFYGDYIPFLGPAHISNSKIEYPSDGLSEKGLDKGRLIPKNSLMMVCIGGSIGKCYVNNIDVSCNQQINTVTTLKSPIKYIQFVCQSRYFQRKVFLKSSGSATPIINKGKWESIPIPFPSIEEQRVIVKTIETLFKEVEALENLTEKRIELKKDYAISALSQLAKNDSKKEWQALKPQFHRFFHEIDNIKKLRETILQLAVQGKLTAKWRAQNPELISGKNSAENLLEEIKAEKAKLIKEKKIKKEKALPPIKEDEIPYELPKGWVWCRFQELILHIEAGKSPKCNPEPADFDQWGVIKISAISWGDFNSHENKTLPLGIDPFKNKEVKPGDFILSRANTSELIARSVIVQSNVRSKLLLNDKTLRFSFSDLTNKEYLNLYNNGNQARVHYKEVSSGTSDSMKNISRENIKSLKVPLPPIQEQLEIIQKVNLLMNLCDQLEREVETGQQQIEDLMQSVLKKVFEGEKELETA